MKNERHVGRLFSAILVKEAVFDFIGIFLDPTGPPGPFLEGGSKGVQGVKIEVEGYMASGLSF